MSVTKRGVCFQYIEYGTCRFGSKCKFSHDESMRKRPKSSTQSTKRSKKPSKANNRGQRSADHIDGFFATHPEFDYDPSAPIWTEFSRMCDDFGWESDDFDMRQARREFKSAMVQEFNDLYGTDEDDLDSWQNLCRILQIMPVPMGLKECRERVRQTHVNLVDLVDTVRTGESVKVFPNLKKLQSYTIKNRKFFPKEDAYAGGLLRFLLREILNSYEG